MPGKRWWKNPLNLHSSGLWVSLMIGKQLLRRKKKIPEKKMMKSKLISILLPLILGFILLFGSRLKAELFSVSAGIPLSHDIKDENLDSDGVSGFFFHVKFPILVGVGLENYETKIKDLDTKIATTMYDIFYLLPIPVINLTVGLGAGQSELKCSTCSSSYDVGTATQIYNKGQVVFMRNPRKLSLWNTFGEPFNFEVTSMHLHY